MLIRRRFSPLKVDPVQLSKRVDSDEDVGGLELFGVPWNPVSSSALRHSPSSLVGRDQDVQNGNQVPIITLPSA